MDEAVVTSTIEYHVMCKTKSVFLRLLIMNRLMSDSTAIFNCHTMQFPALMILFGDG